MSIPKHSEWKTLKKRYGVADGAVSAINVGKELDRYWNANPKNARDQYKVLEQLEVKLGSYITKLDKKKVKNYTPFQKEFLNKYVGEAHKLKVDAKRYYADATTYKTELTKFFGAVQKLDKAKTTKSDLEKFKSGPVRGLTALGKSVRGVDLGEIDSLLGTINDGIQKLPANPSRPELTKFVETTLKTAQKIGKLAKAKGLL